LSFTVNELEIKRLFSHFRTISGSIQDDDTIELNEFKAALSRNDDVFVKRLFQVFDEDKNGIVLVYFVTRAH
jgi:Ca2+-binding EF-hand superfamily protein